MFPSTENNCMCEPNELSRRACIERVGIEESANTPTLEEEEHCTELLQTCTEEHVCSLLAEGNLAACGRSNF